ncbi:hypothetical protein AVEN_12152-1 [Araneus ventricosus]|uniref:Uncharacterized protein n=1 Tax=Araneus ventricosus TaxID=182803 RepID=A0A4Y2LPV0_ARAVE|nr:hypothetical protein AVEN_12152-1 [Araneus ventricosus]
MESISQKKPDLAQGCQTTAKKNQTGYGHCPPSFLIESDKLDGRIRLRVPVSPNRIELPLFFYTLEPKRCIRSIMPFGPVNPIDTLYGQFEYNCIHSRSLCAPLPLDTSHGGQDNLTEARTDVRSIMSPSGNKVCTSFHVYPLGCELAGIQWC